MRQSNIELLRILCMFMVMCIHTTLAINYPEVHNISNAEYYMIGLLKSFSVVAVDVFVMISGYFGIKFSFQGLCKFLFQVLFFSLVGYLISIALHVQMFSVKTLVSQGCLLGPKNYWFVICYLLLFVLSPVLNSFCENASKDVFKKLLIVFFCIQSIFAWQFATLNMEIKGGLSSISFIGIYLLMRYYKIYGLHIKSCSKICLIAIYVSISFFISCIAYFSKGGILMFVNHFSYASPIVILSALSLFVLFTKISFSNRFVNSVASSCFAVYLLHEQCSINLLFYRPFINKLYYTQNPYISGAFDTLIFMLLIYVFAICLDKIRIISFNVLFKSMMSII